MKYVFFVDCENIPVVKFNGNIVRTFNISNKEDAVIYAFHNGAMISEVDDASVKYVPVDTYRVKDALDMVLCTYLGMSVREYGTDAEYYIISNDKGYTIPALHLKKQGYCVRIMNREQLKLLGRGLYKNYLDMIETELMLSNIEARANRFEEKRPPQHFRVSIPDDVLAQYFVDDKIEEEVRECLTLTGAYGAVSDAVKQTRIDFETNHSVNAEAEPVVCDTAECKEESVVESKSKEKKYVDTSSLKKRIRNGNFDYACPSYTEKNLWRQICILYVEHLDMKKPKLTLETKLSRHILDANIDNTVSALKSAFSAYR